MTFADKLIMNASKWLDCREDPDRANRSVCVDKIHRYTGPVNNDPWCAKFAWMILDKTAKEFGIQNPIPETASTHTLRNSSENIGITVNKNPTKGAIMFYPTGTVTGHVGFVSKVKDSDTIVTIEGNSGDRVAVRTHDIKPKYEFIHTENLGNGQAPLLAGFNPWIAGALGVSLLGGLIYAGTR